MAEDAVDGEGDRAAESGDEPLPIDAVEEAERLTRNARAAVDDDEVAAYEDDRESLLAEHDYTARVREQDDGDVLVLHPSEWLDDDGVVRIEQIDDLDRGIERRLSGTGGAEDWAAVDERNRAVASAVADRHGQVHGDNAAALADFMSNHYARTIGSAGEDEIEEFLTEYFPRNAWPSESQRAVVEESVRLARAVAAELSDSAR